MSTVILKDRLATIVQAMGYEFVGCELQRQGQSSLLRIYIDKESGVTVEDCSKVSRQASAMLDVEDPIAGRYTLEVSSPGIDRPLFELSQYQRFIGNRIKIRLRTPIDERRQWVGLLVQVKEDVIYLLVDREEKSVPFSAIEKANVIADI